MIRRISTKWVLTVLAAVVLPFLGFAWFANTKVAERQWDTVRYYLLSIAGELADRLESEVRTRQQQVRLWTSATPLTEWAVGDYPQEQSAWFVPSLRSAFDRFVAESRAFDLILALNARGELVTSNRIDRNGRALPEHVLAALGARDFSGESWFREALAGQEAHVDHHVTNLLPDEMRSVNPHPENYHVGFAVPVRDQRDPSRVVGVVFGLVNWSRIQQRVLDPLRPALASGELPDLYESCYAWLWMSDADTIIAHKDPTLYTQRVSEPPVSLPDLVAAARERAWGMYPEYEFRGVRKTAAFKHCNGKAEGGFGWVVGVGIDNRDVYATVDELTNLLWQATLLVLSVVVVGTVVIARRTTRPILQLTEQTGRIAAGDLESQVDIRTDDELGELARAFNRMTRELAESRSRLVKAEKDAAWREMARQVAHEIKNPLTPISLSVDLLERARNEQSPQFDTIFDRTVDLVRRQVEAMREIASDFSAFAGARKARPEVVDVRTVLDEVLALNEAWALEARIRIERSGEGLQVRVDPAELRRVLINLVSNAIEAMSGGGTLACSLRRVAQPDGPRVEIGIRDTGVGLSTDVRRRLFEPYFTTRTHGTGLGLAIARRLVDEMGGTIELVPVPAAQGGGTLARVVLPEHAP